MNTFFSVTPDELLRIIYSTSIKSCDLDPVPGQILKKCSHLVLPVLTTIVNLSLESATLPTKLKEALLIPLLKKTFFEH
jgi:hypothetical protein